MIEHENFFIDLKCALLCAQLKYNSGLSFLLYIKTTLLVIHKVQIYHTIVYAINKER